MPATAGCAGSGRRAAHSSQPAPAAEADAPPRQREFRGSRYRATGFAPWRDLIVVPRWFLAPIGYDSPCAGRMGRLRNQAIRVTSPPLAGRGRRELADRPDKGDPAAGRGPHVDTDAAVASGRQAGEQSFQHARAGRVIIADIGHQLPALLPNLEGAGGIV